MSDEEKKAIESLIEIREFGNLSSYKDTKISQLNAIDVVLNLIEKQSKEIEELKEKDDANLAYYDQIYQNGIYTGQKAVEDKIKAKIGKRMQKNNNTIHNAKLKHGKDYVYYDDVQEAKEENRICKEILQSLIGKE